MESKITAEIRNTIGEIESLKAVERHYRTTEEQLATTQSEMKALEKRIDKELQDIENLEGLSVKSIFYKVLGSKEEQMERERQEYLQATLQLKENRKGIEILEYELGLLKKKVTDIADHELRLEHLKELREKEIMMSSSNLRKKLVQIYNEIDHSHRLIAEMDEARKAGMDALQSIQLVVDHLAEAKKWGDWDQMSKSSHYDRRKHSEIDRAVNQAFQTKRFLKIFTNELRDVGIHINEIDFQVESFGNFFDILLDNLITDWVIQNKIKNALRNSEMTYDRVLRLVKAVESDKNKEATRINDLMVEKDQLLMQ